MGQKGAGQVGQAWEGGLVRAGNRSLGGVDEGGYEGVDCRSAQGLGRGWEFLFVFPGMVMSFELDIFPWTLDLRTGRVHGLPWESRLWL